MLSIVKCPLVGLLAGFSLCAAALAADVGDFKDPIDKSKLTFPLKAGETETPTLKKFKITGVNAYRDDNAAIAKGKELYEQWCLVCHNADGSGKMGPSLISKEPAYKQSLSDPGMFSIIYAGATGAMQAFSKRDLSQDEMLKIVAYVRTLAK